MKMTAALWWGDENLRGDASSKISGWENYWVFKTRITLIIDG